MKTCISVRSSKKYLTMWRRDLGNLIVGCEYKAVDPKISRCNPHVGCTRSSGVCQFEIKLGDPVNLDLEIFSRNLFR